MPRNFIFALSIGLGCLAMTTAALAGSRDPDNYPLRVHILKNISQSRHSREGKSFKTDNPDYMDGQGVADLFENSQPTGFSFRYSCVDPLLASEGYGTYPARWKKQGKTLEVLVPQAGRPWNLVTCDLQSEMRTGLAFYWKEGHIVEEAAAVFKDWMVKHQFDPEKGLIEPVVDASGASGPLDDSDLDSGSSSSQRNTSR
jgi:hypothetical protein